MSHWIFALFFLIVSCKVFQHQLKTDHQYSTKTGIHYKFAQIGEGPFPQESDFVKVHYIARNANGNVVENSYTRGRPFVFKIGDGSVFAGLDESLKLMKSGSVAEFTIPADLRYSNNNVSHINENEPLNFHIELLEVIHPPKPYKTDNLDTISMESGLKYILVEKSGNMQKAEAFRTVKVHYTGYLLNGKKFDSSVERGEPLVFKLGVGSVIKGWDEGISYLHVGDKARLIIPPHLAYGKKGYPPIIPSNSTLIFDVELIDVLD